MNKELLLLFICLSITNVIISTIKSLCTIKCGKGVAAIVSAFSYAFNVVMTVYMVSDLPLGVKAFAVGMCNLVGVYIVKYFEEKLRKDKLWKIEVTIPKEEFERFSNECKQRNLSFNYIDINKYFVINVYCSTQEETKTLKEMLHYYHAKYFVSENKIVL